MANSLALTWDLIARNAASGPLDEVSASADRTAASMERAGAATEESGGLAAKGAKGFGLVTDALAAFITIDAGKHLIDMASKFQSSMLLIQTQAGASAKEVKTMSKSVLDLAGPLGTSPEELATSLYHVESTGLRGAKALDVMKIAAEGAKVGHADLEDTTNALTSTVVSGIPGIKNMGQAMGELNAIVGSGDMKMSDLNQALGTGVLTVVKGYGLSITDVGAALATFGDNNIRGADAATMLRMAVQALAVPAKEGTKTLDSLGIKTGELAKDMQQGGLNQALQDLATHLKDSGVKGDQVGAILTEAFGKKAGPGLAVLEAQLGRFQSKLVEVREGGDKFGADWKATTQTASFQFDQLKASLESLGIRVGTALLPPVSKAAGEVSKFITFLATNKNVAKDVSSGFSTFGGVIKAVTGFISSHRAEEVALFKTVRDDVAGAFTYLSGVVTTVVTTLTGYYTKHETQFADTFSKVENILRQVGQVFQSVFTLAEVIVQTFVKVVTDLWDRFGDHLLDHIRTQVNAVLQVFSGVLKVIEGVVDVFTGVLTGKWSKAWTGLKDIASGALTAVEGLVKGIMNLISTIIGATMAVISAAWDLAWNALVTVVSALWKDKLQPALQATVHGIEGFFSDAGSWLVSAGEDIVNGLIKGVEDMAGDAADAVGHVASGLVKKAKDVLGIFSPSKVFQEMGHNVVDGLVLGIQDYEKNAEVAAASVAQKAVDAANAPITQTGKSSFQYGDQTYASNTAATNARNRAIESAENNKASAIAKAKAAADKKYAADTKSSNVTHSEKFGADTVTSVVAGVNKQTPNLKKAINDVGAAMADAFKLKNLQGVVATAQQNLSNLQGTLDSLTKSATDFASNAASANLGTANFLSGGVDSTTGTATASSVVASFDADSSKLSTFLSNLAQLKTLGFSSAFIANVAAAGPDAAGAEVRALLSATASQVAEVNADYSGSAAASNAIGALAAADQYGDQIAAASKAVSDAQTAVTAAMQAQATETQSIQALVNSATALSGRPIQITLDGSVIASTTGTATKPVAAKPTTNKTAPKATSKTAAPLMHVETMNVNNGTDVTAALKKAAFSYRSGALK